MGCLVMGSAALMFLTAIISIRVYPPPEHSEMGFLKFGVFVVTAAFVGLGMYHLRKLAALLLSGFTLFLAFWMVKLGVQNIQGRNNRIGLLFAALLLIPSILTIKNWHGLHWARTQAVTNGPKS